ncbi:MAG: PKD domain-containing protein [Verrucomicrobia bacterium]|nr:PKD domain-containing protein [Verrucomicrobiota bacterium]
MLLWTQSQQLLDMTPFSTAGNADASLLIGRSFHDPDQGITVTPIAHGGTAPDDYLTLVVNFTNPTSNSPPVAILTASNLTPPISTAVALTAIASDPDGDPLAFSWDYGDGLSPSVNNSPTQTKSWTTAGDYAVRCTVSDMKGKSSIQKIVIHVGSPSTFTISGRVTQPDGSPVSGVFILDTATHFTSTDADGCYSLGPLATTSATLTAIKNGWTFSTQFFNPVLIGPSASNINFTATAPPDTGSITLEHWDGITGSSVANLTSNPAYPNSPSYSYNLTSLFEAGTNTGSNYGQRARGYFRPPLTGNYTFYIASDDQSELWLSSTDSPTTKTKIASITGYTSVREWTKYSSQKSAPILLSAGSRYYIEALHKENSGSDHLSVGVDFPDSSIHRPLESLYLDPASSLPIPTPPSQISVVASTPSTTEGSLTAALLTLTRSGPTTSPLTVFFTLTATATYGSDFSPTTLSATFGIGESTLTVPIASIDDSTPEPDETVVLTLSPSSTYTIIAPRPPKPAVTSALSPSLGQAPRPNPSVFPSPPQAPPPQPSTTNPSPPPPSSLLANPRSPSPSSPSPIPLPNPMKPSSSPSLPPPIIPSPPPPRRFVSSPKAPFSLGSTPTLAAGAPPPTGHQTPPSPRASPLTSSISTSPAPSPPPPISTPISNSTNSTSVAPPPPFLAKPSPSPLSAPPSLSATKIAPPPSASPIISASPQPSLSVAQGSAPSRSLAASRAPAASSNPPREISPSPPPITPTPVPRSSPRDLSSSPIPAPSPPRESPRSTAPPPSKSMPAPPSPISKLTSAIPLIIIPSSSREPTPDSSGALSQAPARIAFTSACKAQEPTAARAIP